MKLSNYKNIFITTTLPYVNSEPHVGHLFEFVLADAIARYFRNVGKNVFFNTGLDEHGLKVWSKAQEKGISVEDYIVQLTDTWKEFCFLFNIDYDNFYKTSDVSHKEAVSKIWEKFQTDGLIYKQSYYGKYCIGCESFKQGKELNTHDRCPDHPNAELTLISEENYFFKLTNFKEAIIHWMNNNPEFLQPENKLLELINVTADCEDISISRVKANCPWGIEVPNDPEQVMYVWFEALLNYVIAAGYGTYRSLWNDDTYIVQLCGPDNIRFQGLIFQSFLRALSLKNTDKLLVHGTILDGNGLKLSKSLGNGISPVDQLNKYGVDAVRYYILAGLNTYDNSSWNEEILVSKYNNELCNDYGNLITRVLHLIDTKAGGDFLQPSNDFVYDVITKKQRIHDLWVSFNIKEALAKTNELVKYGNKYIVDNQPWAKSNFNCVEILANLYYLIDVVNDLYSPVYTIKWKEVRDAIKNKKKAVLFNRI